MACTRLILETALRKQRGVGDRLLPLHELSVLEALEGRSLLELEGEEPHRREGAQSTSHAIHRKETAIQSMP
ncbi:hypothetical protein SRHO_G00092800 [Serrasalmus rhombeus]